MSFTKTVTKRAWIAIAATILIATAAGGWLIRRSDSSLQRTLAGALLAHTPLADIITGAPPDILSKLPAGSPVIAYMDAAALRKLKDSPLAAMLGLASAGPHED